MNKSKAIALVAALMGAMIASADSRAIDFEPPYVPGSTMGQQGWAGTLGGPINPLIDQEIVLNTYGYSSFDSQSWRFSNAFTNGSFGDWPFSPSLVNEAGEPSAQSGGLYSNGIRQSHFEVQWDFASTVPTAEQAGLQISTAPDRGDGARMSFIRMIDLPAGLAVEFADYQDRAPYGAYGNPATAAPGCGMEDDFVITTVASGLNRTRPHTVRLTMDFVDGPRNDVVKVYVDGTLRHTGGSWEDYFRWCTESGGGTGTATDQSRTVDSMIFQARGSCPGNCHMEHDGNGFLIDNLSYFSSTPTAGAKVTGGGTIEGDPVFSPTGDLISLPAVAASVGGGSSRANFGFVVTDGANPRGNLSYHDHGTDVRIKATSFSSLSITTGVCGPNTHAAFNGTADVNGSPESVKVEVDDCAEPGSSPGLGPDMFSIMTDSYSNSGPLVSGNIKIHK